MKLEDLLKLKKAERPSSSDWQKFDENLERKMLLAIVKEEPFYKKVFQKTGFLRKTAIATAFAFSALALTLFFVGTTSSNVSDSAIGISSEAVMFPKGGTSFATNELSNASSDNMLSPQIKFSDNSRISYADNTISGISNFTF